MIMLTRLKLLLALFVMRLPSNEETATWSKKFREMFLYHTVGGGALE